MADCLAQLLCDASDKRQLDAVPIEEVAMWIQMALALEKDSQQVAFAKRLVMETQAAIESQHTSFQASQIVQQFQRCGHPSEILIGFALAELAQEGTIACLDHGMPATYSFLQNGNSHKTGGRESRDGAIRSNGDAAREE